MSVLYLLEISERTHKIEYRNKEQYQTLMCRLPPPLCLWDQQRIWTPPSVVKLLQHPWIFALLLLCPSPNLGYEICYPS